jgi:GTP pyrophosphokinase
MLPINSSALDFAFSIHTAIGSKCIGAKVNHKLVPISHKLRSGDQVEIITSNKQKPNDDWLNNVVTAKAKNSIKDALREEKKSIAEEGKYTLQRKLESIGAPYSPYNIDQLVNYYKQPSQLDLHFKIAKKQIDLKELKLFLVLGDKIEAPKPIHVAPEPGQETNPNKFVPKKESELIIFGESSDQIKYSLGKCCNPIPGDDVFGFVSTGKGLIIHRTSCPNATQLLANYGHRVVKTKWAKNKEISVLTGLSIVGMDDVGVVNNITTIISGELKINIAAITIESKDGLFEGTIKVYVHDKDELELLVEKIKSVSGIQQVNRFDTETV